MDRQEFEKEVLTNLGKQPKTVVDFLWTRLEKEYNEGYEDGRSEKANPAENQTLSQKE